MKNIYILPTDKPSRLYLFKGRLILGDLVTVVFKNSGAINQHIYITNDSEIKEGDWFYLYDADIIAKYVNVKPVKEGKKIILTTDQDLIKDGVQAIDDEFLEWFVKNPSCEGVEVKLENYYASGALQPNLWQHKIIPKEEPKQETLEEAAEKLYLSHENNELLYGHSEDLQLAYKAGILDGAKWQAERMYSELELEVAFFEGRENNLTFIEWFEQFKKK